MKQASSLLCLLLVAACAQLPAQRSAAIFTHYTVSPWLVNPGMVGFEGTHEVRANYRAAFSGFPGAPKAYALNYSGPMGRNFGIGAEVLAERSAQATLTEVKLSYAFHTESGPFQWAGGFSAGINSSRLQAGRMRPGDAPDPMIVDALSGRAGFEAALGLRAHYLDQTFFGVTFPALVAARLQRSEQADPEQRGGLKYYMVQLGHKIIVKRLSFQVTPSVLLARTYGAPFRADLNVVASFLDEQFVSGLSYRAGAGDQLGMLLGTKVKKVKFYYSYDIGFSDFQSYNNGSHEVTIGVDLPSAVSVARGAKYHQ